MASVLICSPRPLDAELGDTFLWRSGVSRVVATGAGEALRLARKEHDLILVDRAVPGSVELIRALRHAEHSRHASIVLLTHGPFDPEEAQFFEAGANSVLRMPPGPDWDERLTRLLAVPVRKATRLRAQIEMRAAGRGAGAEGLAVTTVNLSLNGVLIGAAPELHLGEELDFQLRLPDGRVIRGAARVARRAGPQLYGLEFEELEGQGTSQLRAFLDQL
jgi:CheY-like chemotaxis protein